jgi:UDP-glucose:(heptosyl)LPS alpha-1,3-glucosyltransferase
MKIAMLVKNFVTTGGSNRYAVELSTRLSRRGHEVHVYAQGCDPALIGGLIFHRIRSFRRPRFLNSFFYSLLMMVRMKNSSFDVIHSHQRTIYHHVISIHHPCYQIGRRAMGIFGKFFQIIKLLTSPRHLVYKWLESRQFKCRPLKCVIAVSKGSRQDILAHYDIEPSMICVINPGVDSKKMSPEVTRQHRADIRKQHGLEDRDVAIVFVGTEFKRKGLHYAIEAVGLLARDHPSSTTHLFVIGGGPQEQYRGLATRLGVGERVHFIGLYTHVEHYYAAADIFLLPTLSDPFPLSVFEAMAFGLPVVVSRGQGVAEVLKNGHDAILLDDPRDPSRIKAALVELSSEQRRRELGRHARETALLFTWDRMVDKIERLYEEVIQQQAPA